MRIVSLVWLFFFLVLGARSLFAADPIRVSLFNDQPVRSFTLSVFKGSYQLFADSNYLFDMGQETVLYMTYANDEIVLYHQDGLLGFFSHVGCYGIESENRFKIKPLLPNFLHRVYDDDLEVVPSYGSLRLINHVAMDHYLSGVVETESGVNRKLEFYKAQVCLARTYALKHLNRHRGEGFDLCDGVHCQAYKRRSNESNILKATQETKGLVITHDSVLINAFFHANCGGQTQNSDQVWFVAEPYLKSVNDPFCLRSRGAKWEKIIALDDWKTYLESNLIAVGTLPDKWLFFQQESRQSHYQDTGIPLIKIRQDWGLKSTFFSVDQLSPSQVLLRGRGYGHGVGLCQEGAMEMANQGFDFLGILNFYFRDIRIIPYHLLPNED